MIITTSKSVRVHCNLLNIINPCHSMSKNQFFLSKMPAIQPVNLKHAQRWVSCSFFSLVNSQSPTLLPVARPGISLFFVLALSSANIFILPTAQYALTNPSCLKPSSSSAPGKILAIVSLLVSLSTNTLHSLTESS